MSRTRTRTEVAQISNVSLLILNEFRKQRHSATVSVPSTNTTINGDSGNVSQEEHEDDQERYFDKIERLKRTENEVIKIGSLLFVIILICTFLESSSALDSTNEKIRHVAQMGTNDGE